VNDAKSANMPFLAPSYFREASQILSDSQSALGVKSRDVLVNNAAKGDAILEKGRAIMAIVQYRFAKELDYKAQLEEYNAPNLLPREYEKVIGDFSGLIAKIEREQPENIDTAKEALLKSMLDLVIKSVQEGALRESALINADSKMKNADKQAPLTYMEAIRVYQDAKSRIAAAYRDKELVQRLGAQATFAARHAQQVNDRVALLQVRLKISPAADVAMGGTLAATGNIGAQTSAQPDGKPAVSERYTLEQVVLQEEDRLLAISRAIGMKDMRDQPLDKQVEAIRHAIIEGSSQPNGEAAVQDYEARLKAANNGIRQNAAELAQKDKQLSEKDKQLTEKDKQLTAKDRQLTEKEKLIAEKNAQIKTLKNQLQSMKLL